LSTTNRCHFRTRNRIVEPACLPIGHDAIRGLNPCGAVCGNGAGGTEINIIRVGSNDEQSLDLVRAQHTANPRGQVASSHV